MLSRAKNQIQQIVLEVLLVSTVSERQIVTFILKSPSSADLSLCVLVSLLYKSCNKTKELLFHVQHTAYLAYYAYYRVF